MAVKITRQTKNIVLLGAPTSAAALHAGPERAPAALRAAGIADRLKAAGFQVADQGDTSTHVFQPDEEHPRARNVPTILKALNELRPRVETAVKSGALPIVLTGDCISVMAAIAGSRRYFRNVSLIYVDRDADLNLPATTPTGCIDGMVISQVIGRGAPELVRFWGEPPLVRAPDVALFGFERLDAGEEQFLGGSPLRRHPAMEVSAVGAAAAAKLALERVHVANHEFVLHFDVDVIRGDEFPWTNFPGSDGLTMNEVRDALRVFVSQPNLAAFVVAGYNPEQDTDGAGARKLIDLLADVLSARLEVTTAAAAGAAEPVSAPSAPIAPASEAAPVEAPTQTEPESGGADGAAPAESPDTSESDADRS